jgi:hypothetical protein
MDIVALLPAYVEEPLGNGGVTLTNKGDPPLALPPIDCGRNWCDLYVNMAE